MSDNDDLASFLGAAAVMLVSWFGKRFLDLSSTDQEIHIHNYMGEMPLEDAEDCQCDGCKEGKPA